MPSDNRLFYGDNLDVLGHHIGDETVDLIYLDPPFKSQQNYNVLFAEKDGSASPAQIKAFEDTWHWDQASAASYHDVVEAGGRTADSLFSKHEIIYSNKSNLESKISCVLMRGV